MAVDYSRFQSMETAPMSKHIEVGRKAGWLKDSMPALLKAVVYCVPLTRSELHRVEDILDKYGTEWLAQAALDHAYEISLEDDDDDDDDGYEDEYEDE